MSSQPKTFLTPEQYLEIERSAEYKSEYYQGEMFAMAGALEAHSFIAANIVAEFREQLRKRPCGIYPSDIRVHTATGLYTYPDVVVVCGERKYIDRHPDTLLNPTVIVEVLSPTTEAYDRGRKFEHYRTIESLREYLLVSSDRIHADLFTRQADGSWNLTSANGPEDAIKLQSIDCRLNLADLYEKVEFASNGT
jgi:Uma2 family endonuclease